MENYDSQLDALILKTSNSKFIIEMDTRAIFRKHYEKFNAIRLHCFQFSRSMNANKETYATIIQKFLTENGIVQKNGNPISIAYIHNQMSFIRKERLNNSQ